MVELDFRAVDWPPEPLDAASHFHSRIVPQVREALDPESDLWLCAGEVPATLDAATIVLPPATHAHEGWRLAAIRELAREAAPKRVNAVVGDDDAAIARALAYLHDAPGVTGQILTVDAISGETD